jgi:hypothetical protein
MMGGRSLRYTGEQIYKTPVNVVGVSDATLGALDEIEENMQMVQKATPLAGGAAAWRQFLIDGGQRRSSF